MPYQLTIEERPSYVHAKVTGELTQDNAQRFLKEAYEACVKAGRTSVLLEFSLAGPSLSATSIFDVISDRVGDALKLKKVAYVDGSPQLGAAFFAETVAMNRGVNVRLFRTVAEAESWLSGGR